jgi:hypothetical protein
MYAEITKLVAKDWGAAPYPHSRVFDRYRSWLRLIEDIDNIARQLGLDDLSPKLRKYHERELAVHIRRRDRAIVPEPYSSWEHVGAFLKEEYAKLAADDVAERKVAAAQEKFEVQLKRKIEFEAHREQAEFEARLKQQQAIVDDLEAQLRFAKRRLRELKLGSN